MCKWGKLIIFTKYPQPGLVKTRLIPSLGEVGAANLSRLMTENTVQMARLFCQDKSIKLAVYFAQSDRDQIANWLGDDLIYNEQVTGDLGDRMLAAFSEEFSEGFGHVIIIGCDCPELNYQILQQGFELLEDHDLVLGKAADGGYYLIGLGRLVPELFKGIIWSSDRVFKDTVNIADNLRLKIGYLPTLTDIDRPADLINVQHLLNIDN